MGTALRCWSVAHTTHGLVHRHGACPDGAVASVLDALHVLLGVRTTTLWTHVRHRSLFHPATTASRCR